MNATKSIQSVLFSLCLAATSSHADAPSAATAQVWNYVLLEGSQLINEGPPLSADPPSIIEPMRGSFRLRPLTQSPLYTRYAVEDISFTARGPAGWQHVLTGHGFYGVGGEVARQQEMFLELEISNGSAIELCFFTNTIRSAERAWPFIRISLAQTNPNPMQAYRLELVAAPLREIWFSTELGFHPMLGPVAWVSPGDLIASSGRVVKSNQQLTRNLGLMPSPDPPALGLDAVDVQRGADAADPETLFSIEHDAWSETLGQLQHGDLLSERGSIVRRNQDLTAAFGIQPVVPDLGLDAVQMLNNGEIFFSLEADAFSERLGVLLRRGDLLSNRGRIVRNSRELLARFHPIDLSANADYGLDAFHVWYNGEIWFSTEEGFTDQNLGYISPGDLLSDHGTVIFRNAELLAAFAPGPDGIAADYGLDALVVESDAVAPPLVANRAWTYTLLPGSYLFEECPPCLRPAVLEPMRGTFTLQLLEENPLCSRYALRDISFAAGTLAGRQYKVAGGGSYERGGHLVPLQDMFLAVRISDGLSTKLCYLTNGVRVLTRPWPILEIYVDQTNGTPTQVYHLNLVAAPLREIWFSTTHGFHPGVHPPFTNYVSPGALVSSTGRVVRRNQQLTARLGIMPSPDPPDLGLDAVDVDRQVAAVAGTVVFSLEQDVWSETLGQLQHGDLLSDRGAIVRRNQELTAAFVIQPVVPDLGLDAVQVLDNGAIHFSIETPAFSERLGVMLQPGDLLSDRGQIVRSNRQLLSRFHPLDDRHDYGLDALYVWPNSEIWFSTEEGFVDAILGQIHPGDLLSDQGVVVYRNLELLEAFAPLEDLGDFGLDALVISRAPVTLAVPLCLDRVRTSGGLAVSWACSNVVLQQAASVTGPWEDVTLGSTENVFMLRPTNSAGFFRLREP